MWHLPCFFLYRIVFSGAETFEPEENSAEEWSMMRRCMRIIIALIVLLSAAPLPSFSGQYKVVRAVDGDTVVIEYFGKQEKVRLLCVNTPESVHPDKKQNIPMGKVASDFTATKLTGKYVELEFGPERRDRYGRLLGYLILEGVNFNVEMVRNGLSPYYTKYGLSRRYDRQFREAEKFARKNKLNIWGDPELTQKYLRLKSKWGQEREDKG
jgi:endonuclease YncB( thermonuclease family)